MAIYRHCGRCGKEIPSGSKCSCLKDRYREYDKYSRDKEAKKFYTTKQWRIVRAHVLSIDEIDVYLYMTTGEVEAANEVHHIVPRRDDETKEFEVGNLISLTHSTHSKIEMMYKENKGKIIAELTEMLREFRKGRGGNKVFNFVCSAACPMLITQM